MVDIRKLGARQVYFAHARSPPSRRPLPQFLMREDEGALSYREREASFFSAVFTGEGNENELTKHTASARQNNA